METCIRVLVTVALCSSFSSATFNLFMNHTETKRILGIDFELFYVRDNAINEYALGFNVPIKPEIEDLYFSWQHTTHNSRIKKMFYNMSVSATPSDKAIHTPQVSIPRSGQVPHSLQVFRVLLRCTNKKTAEINVVITLNVTLHNLTHPAVLQIRRKKTCVKHSVTSAKENADDPSHSNRKPGDHGNNNPTYRDSNSGQPDYGDPGSDDDGGSGPSKMSTSSMTVFYVAIGAAVGLLLLIVCAIVICYCRSQKHNHPLSDTSSSALTAKSQYSKVETPSTSVAVMPVSNTLYNTQHTPTQYSQHTPTQSLSGGSTTVPMTTISQAGPRRPLPPLMELTPEETDGIVHEIQIDRKKLSLGEILHEGTFGKIYRGTMLIEMENEPRTTEMEVYIKTVTDAASPGQIDTMLREGCALRGQIHPNINPVLASCLERLQPPMLLYQFLTDGNLKLFLQRSKISEYTTQQSLNTQQLVYMATQVVRGVQFLHRKRILHRDIATRNCVVNRDLIVRVADRGLSRDLFPGDYHCLGDNDNRPVKWMSIEALVDRQYSYASDVWSFGVTLWEILSLGQQPYADVDPFEMAAYLKEGYRVSQPINCPDELFAVMACCWALNPAQRPSMAQLQVCMADFYTALTCFI